MVIFGGSAGSFTLTEMTAEKFYEAGMNVMAVAYRDVEGAPSTLSGIPVELIANAVYWCKENVAEKNWYLGNFSRWSACIVSWKFI